MLAMLWAGVAGGQSPSMPTLVPTTRHAPDEFGTQDYTVTVISATSFTSDSSYVTDYGTLFRYFPSDSSGHHYFANLSVPAGVVIDTIGLESASTATGELTATLFWANVSGETHGIAAIANTPHSFDTDYTASPLGLGLAKNVHNEFVLDVYQVPNSQPLFGWVEIWWRRQVSSAPATASFNDVPTSHPFFQFIEALKASGITGGCQASPPLYCPDGSLTRGQMAVFVIRAFFTL